MSLANRPGRARRRCRAGRADDGGALHAPSTRGRSTGGNERPRQEPVGRPPVTARRAPRTSHTRDDAQQSHHADLSRRRAGPWRPQPRRPTRCRSLLLITGFSGEVSHTVIASAALDSRRVSPQGPGACRMAFLTSSPTTSSASMSAGGGAGGAAGPGEKGVQRSARVHSAGRVIGPDRAVAQRGVLALTPLICRRLLSGMTMGALSLYPPLCGGLGHACTRAATAHTPLMIKPGRRACPGPAGRHRAA